jgi:hypothetical protein
MLELDDEMGRCRWANKKEIMVEMTAQSRELGVID